MPGSLVMSTNLTAGSVSALTSGRTDGGHGLGDDGLLGARAAADGRKGQERQSEQAQEPGAAGRAMFTHSPLS